MNVLIVGADYIDQIRKTLSDAGLDPVEHWTGRKPGDARKSIPRDVEMVVMFTDRVSHGLAERVRDQADRRGIPVVYTRRRLDEVQHKLAAFQQRAA